MIDPPGMGDAGIVDEYVRHDADRATSRDDLIASRFGRQVGDERCDERVPGIVLAAL